MQLTTQMIHCFQVGCKLVVINLSNQSDSSDLLGGYRPIQASQALVPLALQFDQLMRDTWPQGKNEAFLERVRSFTQARNWAKLVKSFDVALAKVWHLLALTLGHLGHFLS
jgi:midasin